MYKIFNEEQLSTIPKVQEHFICQLQYKNVACMIACIIKNDGTL